MARSAKSKPVTKEAVLKALDSGAASISQVAKALGFKGSVGSATTKKIRAACPGIEKRLKANKGAGKAKKPKTYSRHETNPYREGSAYAAAYDVLAAAGERGIRRADLVKEVARLTGKPERNASVSGSALDNGLCACLRLSWVRPSPPRKPISHDVTVDMTERSGKLNLEMFCHATNRRTVGRMQSPQAMAAPAWTV